MHELFEHTADLGLRAAAPDLDTLFAEMGRCLTSALVEDPAAVEARHEVTILIAGDDREFLLFDFLRHLLYLFDDGKWLFRDFEVKLVDEGVSAIGFGEEIDPVRHSLSHEVKAITYHGLLVEHNVDGWSAEVIVDI